MRNLIKLIFKSNEKFLANVFQLTLINCRSGGKALKLRKSITQVEGKLR